MTLPLTAQPLNDSLTTYLHQLPAGAKVSLAVESLTNDRITFAYQADKPVPSASVIKLPIMLEVMEQVKANQLDLDEIHILTDAEKVGGDGVLKTYSHRSRVAYRDLLRLMMIYSDNTATNIFINELGMDTINRRMRTVGLSQSQLNRVMMDTLAVRQGRENYVTAREMNVLLSKIYRNEVATPALCSQMLTILKQNEDRVTLPGQLPKGTVIAHKTGTLAYVRGDVGIVYAAKPFLASVFVEGIPTSDAERIIAEIALICYTYFSRP
ncbi:serine hydrolase [Spirosoma utsteinense]|uniref:beta-lactamase n=1 Tax=Spirosoma utsteinense TaxID=2585773 RepID=A0ABR6W992_9BACT|nr:serine hydrolase [Spirosoma utsteinense]MBC3788984.1 beta-lactamase class A [Spirosoma utsteinense]MBC3792521.1 beta-lactamase class A [Spirosoma utsteinense]